MTRLWSVRRTRHPILSRYTQHPVEQVLTHFAPACALAATLAHSLLWLISWSISRWRVTSVSSGSQGRTPPRGHDEEEIAKDQGPKWKKSLSRLLLPALPSFQPRLQSASPGCLSFNEPSRTIAQPVPRRTVIAGWLPPSHGHGWAWYAVTVVPCPRPSALTRGERVVRRRRCAPGEAWRQPRARQGHAPGT